jgi:small basic protein
MLYLLNLVGDTYSSVMAVVNYVCFAALCGCCVIIYIAGVVGQFHHYYKTMAVGSFLLVVVLCVIHYFLLQNLGIPLLVPPVGSPYFTEFMHVIQYLVTLAVVILGGVIFGTALLSRFDRFYSHAFMSALMFLIVLVGIHYYIFDSFGIPLIFPPNLW